MMTGSVTGPDPVRPISWSAGYFLSIESIMNDSNEIPERETVIAAVEALFRDPAAAGRWLATYNADLGAIPRDCLATAAGRERVMATIGRIGHGVFG